MSLASRTIDLLSASSTTQAQNHDSSLADDGCVYRDFGIADATTGRRASNIDTMASQEVEEEGRPPYLHVSYPLPCRINANIIRRP